VHGEPRHQAAHAELARQCQVKKIVIPSNGQIIRLGPGVTEVVGEVPHGQIGLDGKVLRPLNNNAMKDRRRIGFNGAAVVTIVLDRGGRLVDRPKMALLGLVGSDADLPMIEEATCAVEDAIEAMPKSTRIDDQAVRHKVQQILRRTLNDLHGKKPLTEVHVVRV